MPWRSRKLLRTAASRSSWSKASRAMQTTRVVNCVGVLACAHCGGRLRLIATLHDPAVIRTILAHLAPSRAEPSPGPGPPESGAAAS